MADTQNPGTGPTQQQAKDQLQALKEVLKLQGDYRDILRDSVKELQATLKSYDKMEAKLATINRSTINIKDIESQIKKTQEEKYLNNKKLVDLEKSLSDSQKQATNSYLSALEKRNEIEQDILRAQKEGNNGLLRHSQNMLNSISDRIQREEAALNVEQLAYAQAVKTDQLNKEILDKQNKQLDTEKAIRKDVGLTGAAFKLMNDKLGIGAKVYDTMIEKARKLKEEGKKFTFGDKLSTIGGAALGGLKEAITDPLTAIPLAGAAIGGVIKGLMSVFNYILEIQDKTTKFARAMNLSTDQARKIKMEFADLSISSGDLFINSQKMMESQMEFVDALGVTNRLSNEQLATNIKLKDITGLDLETRKGIVEASTITGKSSDNITKSVLAQVVGLKQATGISFSYQKVLKEASNLGGYLGLSFAKYPAQLTKSLLTVKAMGLELKQLDSIADSFLDFESSISKEFEAQLLTGKDINLTKAREAFLNNDLATAASEITSQVGSANDFLKLNRIQAESLASAFGMSRDQMGEMLKQQELLSKLGAKQGDSAKEQLRLGLERYKNQKALSAAIGEEAYQSLVNASAQEKIAAFIEKIKQSVADFVEKSGIIEKIEGFINYLSEPENVRKVIVMVRDVFAQIVDIVTSIASGIISIFDFFGVISDAKAESYKSFLSGAGDKIRSLGAGGATGENVNVGEASAKKEAGTGVSNTNVNAADAMSMAKPGPTNIYLYPIAGVDSKLMSTSIGRGVGDTNKVIQ